MNNLNFDSRIKFHHVTVGDKTIEVPAAVRRREYKGYRYWLVRLHGNNKVTPFPFKNSLDEFEGLIKALEVSINLIRSHDPSTRLHKTRVAPKSDPSLPVGVTGPFQEKDYRYFNVTIPFGMKKVRGQVVSFKEGEEAEAREKAIALRKQGEEAFKAACKAHAEVAALRILNTIHELRRQLQF